MSLEQTFAEYFKPEIQRAGHKDFVKGLAFISSSSDTQMEGFVKGMTPMRVSLRTDDIASSTFSVTCTCPTAARGSYCKHMWAVMLAAEKKNPDFFDSKTEIGANERVAAPKTPKPKVEISPEAAARAAEYKAKQSEIKKAQYEKQKAYAKELRAQKKAKARQVEETPVREKYSDNVEEALTFFTENGFIMEDIPHMDVLSMARKHLSRVFHPDKGGTHDEATLLNKHHEVLKKFITMVNK